MPVVSFRTRVAKSCQPVVVRFRTNLAGYWSTFAGYWIAVTLAAALDAASTIRFMLAEGVDHEAHPVIRLVAQLLGPVAGPLVGKLCQLAALFLITVHLRGYARYMFVTVTLIYLWAAWYNVWGGAIYTPMFLKYL